MAADDRRAGAPMRNGRVRVVSVDLLRGLIMIVMALDHVRDFTHRGAMTGSPTDLATTSEALFLTRWITHFCAPAFALTAGIAAWLWWSRGRSREALSLFLVTRGLWLMALEIAVMQFAYYFAWPTSVPILLLVLWSLGLSMVILAGLIWLPAGAIFAISAIAIFLHPLLDPVQARDLGAAGALWNIVHQVGAFDVDGALVATPYPLIPWAGVMAFGFALGPLFRMSIHRRVRSLVGLGAALIVAFLVLRLANGYGDPLPWDAGPDMGWTLLSFLNVSKYPASPAFLLMTLGVIILALAALERMQSLFPSQGFVLILGSVPLFFYILHFFIAHLFAAVLWFIIYGAAAAGFAFNPYPSFGGSGDGFPSDFGLPLWGTYCVWVAVLATTYPLCAQHSRAKARSTRWWMRYL